MDPVWTLFSCRTLSRLAYWLSALGYDLRDRSVANRIYLLYFGAFWSLWAIAVFALLGEALAGLFADIQTYSQPPRLIMTLGEYAYVIWALVTLWQVSGRSPFVFSEADAYLLCQTPVDRRKVGLLWYLRAAIGAAAPFAVGAVVLSFGLVEWRFQGQSTIFLIFESMGASLRAWFLILPMQIGLGAAIWALGAKRLHLRAEPRWLRPFSVGATLSFLAGFFIPGLHSLLMTPLRLTMAGAFSMDISFSARLAYLFLSLLYGAAGILLLLVQCKDVNLGRAAQETTHFASLAVARRYGQYALLNSMLLLLRLGSTRSPSRLLARSDRNALFRKDLLQSLRSFRPREIVNLIWLFGLSLGMFGASNVGLQIVMAGIWTISVGGHTTRRLRSDLAHWWLFRSLPLSSNQIFIGEMILPCGIATSVSWLALAFSKSPGNFILFAGGLAPLLAANAALAAVHDILRHSKTSTLMSPGITEDDVPRRDIGGAFQGLICVLIPYGILVGAFSYLGHPVWGLAVLPAAAIITWLNCKAVLSAFLWIE